MAFSEGLSQFDPEMLESEHESIVDSEDEDLDVERSFEGLELRDVDLIKQAGENIFRRIMYDFPEELPDAVLLPDKGARPLWSLAKPVFDSLAEQRGVKPPRYFFVSTAKNDLVESGLHLEKHNPRRVERIREAHANDLAERQREQLAKIAADAPYYASREVRMESAQKAGEVIEDVEASSVENEAVTEAELSPTANEERDSNERKGWRRRLANLFTSRQHVPHEIDAEGLKAVEALNDADALHSWRLAEIKERGLKDVVDPTFIIMDEYMTSLQSTVSLIERGLGSHVHAYALATTKDDWKSLRNYPKTHVGALVPAKHRHGLDLRLTKDALGVTKDAENMTNPYSTERLNVGPQKKLLRKQLAEIGQEIAETLATKPDDSLAEHQEAA